MDGTIWDHFAIVRDPRIERKKKHKLKDILAITLCGAICGLEHWTHIEDFAITHEQWFRSFLDLPNGIPSHDTIGRLFAALEPQEFEKAFHAWVHDLAGTTAGKHIAIDGKTLRRSFDKASKKAAIHMVSAWVHENHAAFGQLKVDDKTNEIKAIPKLLEILNLKGATVTIDAMGCQREICQQIVDKDGHYVLALKGNQGQLYEDVELFMNDAIDQESSDVSDVYESCEKGHGRIEQRTCWTSTQVSWLRDRHAWPALSSIAAVECRRTIDGKTSTERRYFISSHDGRCAQRIATVVRNHWRVETELHWMLDVCFGEDDSRVRMENAAENLSRVRRIALMLLKQEKTAMMGVKGKRMKAAYDKEYLLKVLNF